MDFTDVVKKRRSIRKYKPDPIPPEIIVRILEVGQLAPTWANMQGARVIVIDDPTQVKTVAELSGQRWLINSLPPIILVMCISPRDSGKNVSGLEYFLVDAAIVMEHIVLAATNEGLGTCWIGYFPEEKLRDPLAIPKLSRIIALTPLGYPDQVPKEQIRNPIKNMVYRNTYKTVFF